MGRSAWSWSSNGRATASVTGLALDGSTVTNDLELQALCPAPLGIPKLNWNLRLNWNPKAQLESSGESVRTSVLPVARRSLLAPVKFAGNPKQFKTNWIPRARLESSERAHASPASAPPTGTWLLLGGAASHTQERHRSRYLPQHTAAPRPVPPRGGAASPRLPELFRN